MLQFDGHIYTMDDTTYSPEELAALVREALRADIVPPFFNNGFLDRTAEGDRHVKFDGVRYYKDNGTK